MTFIERIPVLIACLVWGYGWRGNRILVWSDNTGVVGSVARGWSANPRTMDLLRHLLFVAARRGFTLEVRYVAPDENGPADALSRGEMGRLRRLCPAALQEPDPLPAGLGVYLAAPDAGLRPVTGYPL